MNPEIYNGTKMSFLGFEIMAHQGEEDEMINCFIPSVMVSYLARTWEDVTKKGKEIIEKNNLSTVIN